MSYADLNNQNWQSSSMCLWESELLFMLNYRTHFPDLWSFIAFYIIFDIHWLIFQKEMKRFWITLKSLGEFNFNE